ncbi:MAG: class I SAM-dependent methyltransferase [Flavobacteriaceae bacterium]
MDESKLHASSFRDPSGYIFTDNEGLKRIVNPIYFQQYKTLKASGFFKLLFSKEMLIPHDEVSISDSQIIIKPDYIDFITYPYEWGFNQYKAAALLTLKIQKTALQHGFSLKDASAFNVTFYNGKMIFIDTLSFDFYKENTPWRAYKQFVMHFLGPLVLAHYHGSHCLKLLSSFIDGIPLKTIASMLPFKTRLNPFLYTNIHLLAKFENEYNEGGNSKEKEVKLSKKSQLKIIESLYDYIKKLRLKEKTEWGDYYDNVNYSEGDFKIKQTLVSKWAASVKPKNLIDIGGNDGSFVRALPKMGLEQALVCDVDNTAIDTNYKTIFAHKETYITPFVLDVLSPSPAIGFNNTERFSFIKRIKKNAPDLTLALAVIHHMSLTGNISFDMSARFFASFSKHLVIEFPERNDSWVVKLLNDKREFKGHFEFYNINEFETVYTKYFTIKAKQTIGNSKRTLYLMEVKSTN